MKLKPGVGHLGGETKAIPLAEWVDLQPASPCADAPLSVGGSVHWIETAV